MNGFSGLRLLFLSMILSSSPIVTALEVVHKYDFPADCKGIAMTMIHDAQGKDFLYVASKEAGLKIYNIAATPVLEKTIAIDSLRGLHVMNLSQSGNYLYLALGNHFGIAQQNPGFAIVDVSDPGKAFVVSIWSDAKQKSGAGALQCVGAYLYLCAMKAGLMIFDVSDAKNVKQISVFVPDIHFPDTKADQSKINARGLAIRGDMLYLCYDAGGLRIINIKDKAHPYEAARYSNPAMNGKPRAYNNVVVDGPLVYVTADYCGMEVLRTDENGTITPVSWWNPWNCPGGPFQWFKSEGHANEIAFDSKDKLLFLSTGKSDLNVVSVADPAVPTQVYNYGGPQNHLGTWGVSLYENEIYLSYICTFIPFQSHWTGVKVLSFETKP